MRIGVPREIKVHEYRVGLVPASVREFTARGHEVFVQSGAGAGIGMTDDDYAKAGAVIVPDAATVFAASWGPSLWLAQPGPRMTEVL